MCLRSGFRAIWKFASIDRRRRNQGRGAYPRLPTPQKCNRLTTCQCWSCTISPRTRRQAAGTTKWPLLPSSIWRGCRMLAPIRSQPASVPHSCLSADSVAWDLDGGRCGCGRMPALSATGTWNFSPHPSLFRHSSCRSTFSGPGRSARIRALVSCRNVERHRGERCSYASAPR